MSRQSGFSEDARRPREVGTFAEVMNSFAFSSSRKRRKQAMDEDEAPDQWASEQADGEQEASPEKAGPEKAGPEPVPYASSIRSYTWTGGRTKSNHQLELETLVSTSGKQVPSGNVRMEHQSIADLCHHPRSVAEVGALLGVPIGVARVLLADMAELGLVSVHQTVTENGSTPNLMLMERVLSGLRRL